MRFEQSLTAMDAGRTFKVAQALRGAAGAISASDVQRGEVERLERTPLDRSLACLPTTCAATSGAARRWLRGIGSLCKMLGTAGRGTSAVVGTISRVFDSRERVQILLHPLLGGAGRAADRFESLIAFDDEKGGAGGGVSLLVVGWRGPAQAGAGELPKVKEFQGAKGRIAT